MAVEEKAGVPKGAYFLKKFAINIDPSKLTNDLITMLVQVGAEFVKTYEVTKTFHADCTMKPAVAGLATALGLKPVAYFKE